MDAENDKGGSAGDTGPSTSDAASDLVEPALGNPSPGNSPDGTSSLNGPAVLAQPPVTGASTTTAEPEKSDRKREAETSRPKLDVIKGVFATAQDAVASGYRTVSSPTDEFVRESPWKSIAFAVLGGIIVGMLAAR
jgi:ElaB/YqjD/DUF883 family membrane-anchored ribosome-binding protein